MGGQNAAAQTQQKQVAQPEPKKEMRSRGGYFGAANTGVSNAGLLNSANTQRNTFLGI